MSGSAAGFMFRRACCARRCVRNGVHSTPYGKRCPMTRHLQNGPAVALLSCLLLAGCEEEMRSKKKAAVTTPPPSPAAEDSGFIVGKRTQDIRKAEPEIAKGAQVATQKITAKDPITLQGNAYVTMIGKTSILQIEAAVKLFQGANDRYPKDYDE